MVSPRNEPMEIKSLPCCNLLYQYLNTSMVAHAYNPSPEKLSQRDFEFQVILNGIISFMPAHATKQHFVKNKKK